MNEYTLVFNDGTRLIVKSYLSQEKLHLAFEKEGNYIVIGNRLFHKYDIKWVVFDVDEDLKSANFEKD